jgi:hypothetical protein
MVVDRYVTPGTVSRGLFSHMIVVFYSANMGPRFTRGMWAMISVSIALAIWTMVIWWFQRRDVKKRQAVLATIRMSGNDQAADENRK